MPDVCRTRFHPGDGCSHERQGRRPGSVLAGCASTRLRSSRRRRARPRVSCRSSAAVLAYATREDGLALFVLTKTPPYLEHFVIPIPPGELDSCVLSFCREAGAARSRFRRDARVVPAIGRACCACVGKTRLALVPEGVLWRLPFQVLQPFEGRTWIKNVSIFYAQSVTAWIAIRRRRAANFCRRGRIAGSA